MQLRRPSGRTLLIGGLSFVAGLALAAALAVPLVLYFARAAVYNVTDAAIIGPLVAATQLLGVADRQPDDLLPVVAGKAAEQSIAAANSFDQLSHTQRQIVLRQFARLDGFTTVRSEHGPAANAARLARVMVLCTHQRAQPGWVDFSKDSGATVGVPAWVLDPAAKPERPDAVTYGRLRFVDPRQVDAIVRHWDSLHQWVVQHQGCAASLRLLAAVPAARPGRAGPLPANH